MTKLTAGVTFICGAPPHLAVSDAHGTLTVNGVAWAFCPSALITGHEWRPLDPPAEIQDLRRDWRSFASDPDSLDRKNTQPSRRSPK